MNTALPCDIAWLAGFLEGEGTFGMYPRGRGKHVYPTLQVTTTDRDVAKRAAKLLHVPLNGPYPGVKRGNKPRWVVGTSGATAAAWMVALFPYMGQRRQRRIAEVWSYWRKTVRRPTGRPSK